MFRSNLKIALRYLVKNKGFSFINIFGLSIGLTCCLLIAVYIRHELSYDNFQQKGNRIARVIMEYSFDGSRETQKGNFTSVRVASVFKSSFPEVEAAVKMDKAERVIQYKESLVNEKSFMYADPDFFKIFSFHLLQGDPARVLENPHSVILTRTTANRYFGQENPVGKFLRVGNDSSLYQVTGVLEDCPINSQIKFDFLASFSSKGLAKEYENTYWDANYTTFILLKSASARNTLQAKLPDFMKKEMTGSGATVNFQLEPFMDIHLHSPFDGFEPNNNIQYIFILAGVALLILVIACSTFINLSTAQSLERAKEVGIRKVIGAGRKQLFWQFIGESAALCILSLLLSLLLSLIFLPSFNRLTSKQLPAGSLFSIPFLVFALFITALVSFLAGAYPAFALTRFQPVKVLKGSFKNLSSGQQLRKSLIIFQFALSVFMIIATFIIQEQLFYIQHRKLGYDRAHVLVVPADKTILPKLPLIKQEFTTNPDVLSVSSTSRSPVEGGGGYNMRSSVMPESEQIAVTANPIDEDFVKTTGLSLIAGEDLTRQDMKDALTDSTKQPQYRFILNESAARELGWTPVEAVGKKMFLGDNRPGYVKGVVKDFNFESLHNPVKSFVLFTEARENKLLLKLSGQHLTQTISFLGSKWKELVPGRPFEYRFMDDDYNTLYHAELRLGNVMNVFSLLAIVLACLGLFGLSSYAIQQRTKEIGVRKVLGASVNNIVLLLSGGFVKLTSISILISFPLAWWCMTEWLAGYTYRISMNWYIYLMAGAIVLLLSLCTVVFQSVKAALANPVKNLRTE